MTARQYLEFISVFYDRWDWQRSGELLAQFEIDPACRVDGLSKAGKIQLAVVTSLSHRPQLLILDEPTSDLDAPSRHQLLSFLQRLAKEQGVAIILSSRISDDVARIGDSVLMLSRKKAAYWGMLHRNFPT
jgi:ABC-2 type transport system ATP-binding protein